MFISDLNGPVPENSVQDSPDLNRVWEHLLLHNFILKHQYLITNHINPTKYNSSTLYTFKLVQQDYTKHVECTPKLFCM